MIEALIPMVLGSSMFAMIFGIVYLKSRENMAMIERGLNPKSKDYRPRPFVNLKWGLLLIGSGLGLLMAIIIDKTMLPQKPANTKSGITIQEKHKEVKKKVILKTVTDTLNKGAVVTTTDTLEKDLDNDGDNKDGSDVIEINGVGGSDNSSIYFALIAIGGGLGLFFSYRIEKKEWLDKKVME